MTNEIKCPKCNQVTNQMIDHLPLEFKTMPFDDELYATFQCLQMGCHEVFKKVLKVSVPEQKQTEDKGLMIVVEREVPRQVIEDVFVTALEGGSNYWYFLPDEAIDLIRKAVPKSVDPYLSTAISKAILDHGVEVPIHDAEEEDSEVGVISLKTIQERLQKLATECQWAFDNEMEGNGDASSSDVWMQYMAMGEVVFG